MEKIRSKNVYRKILPGGKIDDAPVTQSDFDLTVQYIKKSFPKATTLQRDVEQTLKRTFVLGNTEKERKYLTRKRPVVEKINSSRKLRLKKERPVPRCLKYDQFVQLNEMWKSYVSDLLQDEERPEEIQTKLNRIDLHGAHLTVSNSNCKDYVRIQGIVVKETKNIFILVTSSGATKSVPKAENIFEACIKNPNGKLTICGNSFLTRPAERASKKVKSFMEHVGARVYKSRLRYTYPK